MDFKDYGANPFVVNIEDATLNNTNFRTTKWTGQYLQMTLMSIDVGGEVGLEQHTNTDQFLRIEAGKGNVVMGPKKEKMDFEHTVADGSAIFVPSGFWHNIVNTGEEPLKIYSIYAPPHHKHSTIHGTYEDAIESEEH